MIPVLTICLPCYGRPLRTRRMLACLAEQTLRNFELVMIGDACPDFQKMIESEWFFEWRANFKTAGSHLFYMQLKHNRGGHGAGAVNMAIRLARGKYFCWANNDDMLLPEHIESYYTSIVKYEGSPDKVDFVYNRSLVNGEGGFDIREPELKYGSCGHSELIVNMAFLRSMPLHQPVYGQDWQLIEHMMKSGNGKKGVTVFPTYMIMSTPRYQEQGID